MMITGDHNTIIIKNDNKDSEKYHEIKSGIGILTQLVINAELLSNKIYQRSGIYLIFGVLIAFSGVLFFIEFITFFFLKQYRAAMNEFKYHEEIKRNRESQLTLYLMALKDFDEKDFFKIVNEMNFFRNVGFLSKGETTETIESSKINENEIHKIMNESTDIIKVSKEKL